jgi:hypothetical protein
VKPKINIFNQLDITYKLYYFYKLIRICLIYFSIFRLIKIVSLFFPFFLCFHKNLNSATPFLVECNLWSFLKIYCNFLFHYLHQNLEIYLLNVPYQNSNLKNQIYFANVFCYLCKLLLLQKFHKILIYCNSAMSYDI